MRPHDQALLLLLAIATAMAVVVFKIRRQRGSSRATSTFAAGCAFGGVLAIAMALLYDAFFPPRASIGLERLVTPLVTMVVCTIGSTLAAGLVHVIGGRDAATVTAPAGSESQRILADVDAAFRQRTAHDSADADWRSVAWHVTNG